MVIVILTKIIRYLQVLWGQNMIRIVVVGSEPPERDSLRLMLGSQPDFELAGSGYDGYDAIQLVEDLKPDIAILDEYLPILDGALAIPSLKRRSPKTGIIILTAFHGGEDKLILRAIKDGAAGFLPKDTEVNQIALGVRIVHGGGYLMSQEIAAKAFRMIAALALSRKNVPLDSPILPEAPPLPPNISRRDLQIISCLGQGLSNKEIGETMHRAEGTIRNYVSSVLQKTGLQNRSQVTAYACTIGLRGWLEPGPWNINNRYASSISNMDERSPIRYDETLRRLP
jgi:DNA-binding NarL/FixJ family response regulator